MFTLLKPDAVFQVPVTVNIPASQSAPDLVDYVAHFILLSTDSLKAILGEARKQNDDRVVLREVLVGWEDVFQHVPTPENENNLEPLPYSIDNRELALAKTYFARDTLNAYINWATAEPLKNSATPPGITASAASTPS